MAINAALVREIHHHIRQRFKSSAKSSIKSYLDVDSDLISAARGLPGSERKQQDRKLQDAKMRSLTLQELRLQGITLPGSATPGKRLARMLKRDAAEPLIEALRNKQPSDPYKYGEMLMRNPVAGNCQEMSAAAAWYAIQKNAGRVYMATIDEPGDHVFCLVTSGPEPQWTSVGNTPKDRSDAWVIDPWANVCCPLWQYEMQFTLKMVQWRNAGKMVLFEWQAKGEYESQVAWIFPDSRAYLDAFKSSDLDFDEVTSPFSLQRDFK